MRVVSRSAVRLAWTVVLSLAVWAISATQSVTAAGLINVPADHATIQAAIDAAAAGDTIRVRAGTYIEQLVIDKDLTIMGAGMDRTIVRAPGTLVPGGDGANSIVEIFGGASVAIVGVTVSGPGSGTCEAGALTNGIDVRAEAHLDFSFGAVRDIHDSPLAGCFHSGNGIIVGDVPAPVASLTIHHSEITNYQSAGIVVLGFGSTATITHNTITGPGHAGNVATDGIEFPVGSVGTVSHNKVSGNICPPDSDSCGPDWFTQFQHVGIGAGGWGPGTVVTHNVVFDNHVGMLLGEADEISNNQMIDNEFFGLGLIDGEFLIENSKIKGGGGGVWLIADAADTTAVLDHVSMSQLSGPEVDTVECCGFTATVVRRH